MSKSVFQKMHEQHLRWQQDNEAWLADIDVWKKEFHAASVALADIQETLRDAQDGLQVHADAIWEEQQRISAHELSLSEEARAGQNRTDKDRAHIHGEVSSTHERASDRHARLKQYHHGMVAEILKLQGKALKAV